MIAVRPDLADHLSLERIHAAGEIFERYMRNGGNPERLRQCLRLLNRPMGKAQPVPPRTLKARLLACARALQAIHILSDIPVEDQRILTQALHIAVRALRSPSQEGRSSPQRGRPRGPSRTSLIVAALVEEFRHRFGRPNYKEILTLLRIVAPEKFGEGSTPDHLRQRWLAVPRDEAIRFRAQLFG